MITAVAGGRPGYSPTGNMAGNGYGPNSPFNYSLAAVVTCVFLLVILGATETARPKGSPVWRSG